jgi:hypothetical protein
MTRKEQARAEFIAGVVIVIAIAAAVVTTI